MKFSAEIVEVLRAWSETWIRVEIFNEAADDRRRLGLPEIEPLGRFVVEGRGELRALPRTVYLPALRPNEPPLWDCAADLRKIVGTHDHRALHGLSHQNLERIST
jgi:hypothetical protein